MTETIDTIDATNISEFERNKTEILYKDRVRSLDEIKSLLYSVKDSFKNGE